MLSEIITSQWGRKQLHAAMEDPEEVSSFVRLVLAFADVTINTLATVPASPMTMEIMCKSWPNFSDTTLTIE